MKYLGIILFLFLAASGCATKKVVNDTSKTPEKASVTKTTEEQHKNEPKQQNSVAIIETDINTDLKKDSIEPKTPSKPVITTFDHDRFNDLLQKHVSSEGHVNYKNIKAERAILTSYIRSLGKNIPNNNWSKEEKLAYWINAYNAMTIDLILRHYPVSSIKDIKDPWKQRFWQLGDKWYNLDEIEHQIIRKMNEPRIHFALVCAAVSCPKLYNKAFTASTLEEDLTKLTREFLADTSKNNISKNNLKLSKIFSWFTKDFKQEGSLIAFLNQYTDVEISKNAKKQFNTYNWDLNE